MRLRRKPRKLTVAVNPPGESGASWRMKPGDAVAVEWPGAGTITVTVGADGSVTVT